MERIRIKPLWTLLRVSCNFGLWIYRITNPGFVSDSKRTKKRKRLSLWLVDEHKKSTKECAIWEKNMMIRFKRTTKFWIHCLQAGRYGFEKPHEGTQKTQKKKKNNQLGWMKIPIDYHQLRSYVGGRTRVCQFILFQTVDMAWAIKS